MWARFRPTGSNCATLRKGSELDFGRLGVSLHGLGHANAEFAEPSAKGLAGDSQKAGGLMLAAAGVFENAGQQEAIQLAVGIGVEIAGVWLQSAVDEGFEAD